MFTLHLIHMVLRAKTLPRVMSVLRLLDRLCLNFMYCPLFWEVMLILIKVAFLLPKCIFLLPEHMFLFTECLMGHLMRWLMDPIMGCSMDRVLHLMGAGQKLVYSPNYGFVAPNSQGTPHYGSSMQPYTSQTGGGHYGQGHGGNQTYVNRNY